MSNITANIVVESNPITVVVEPFSNIGVTVEPTSLNIFATGGLSVPGGNAGELQFNTGEAFGGIPTAIYNDPVLSFSGEVNFTDQVNFTNQVNFTDQVEIDNLTITDFADLGDVSNIKITGGQNGFVLQTDGTGNLFWTAAGGGTGNGVPGGVNTQVQFNDEGSFGGNIGFTFNKTSGNVNIPGIINGDGSGIANILGVNVTGEVANAAFATSAESANTANTANTANSALSVDGANVVGEVANAAFATSAESANTANTANTVVNAAQPNITSLGTLLELTVQGTTSIQQAIEKVTLDAVPAGNTATIDFNLLDQAILYKTANTANSFNLNFRGNSTTTLDSIMNIGESTTCSLLLTNGSVGLDGLSQVRVDGVVQAGQQGAFYAFGDRLDGISLTPNAIDIFNFNIIKVASQEFNVFVNRVGYF